MSTGAWKRCSLTGVPKSTMDRVDDGFQNIVGEFNSALLPDCDLFDVPSIAAAAGYGDVRYFREKVLSDPRSFFHCHSVALTDAYGEVVVTIFATYTNSAVAGGMVRREFIRSEQQRRAIATQVTDVSSSAAGSMR